MCLEYPQPHPERSQVEVVLLYEKCQQKNTSIAQMYLLKLLIPGTLAY